MSGGFHLPQHRHPILTFLDMSRCMPNLVLFYIKTANAAALTPGTGSYILGLASNGSVGPTGGHTNWSQAK